MKRAEEALCREGQGGEGDADSYRPLHFFFLAFQNISADRAILETQHSFLSSFFPKAMLIAIICVPAFRTWGPKINQSVVSTFPWKEPLPNP